ncbi:MAG: hypothetical protein ACYS0K_14055 [Planctomycetota bacterium]
MEKAKVSLRGWDYPCLSPSHEQRINASDSIGSWEEFEGHREYWSLYRSGQFVHLFSFREDFPRYKEVLQSNLREEIGDLGQVSGFNGIVTTVWTFAEVFEFAARLVSQHVLEDGGEITLEMHGTEGRALSFFDRARVLYRPYIARAASIKREPIRYTAQGLLAQGKRNTVDAAVFFFERFGAGFPRSSIEQMYEDLYRKRLDRS